MADKNNITFYKLTPRGYKKLNEKDHTDNNSSYSDSKIAMNTAIILQKNNTKKQPSQPQSLKQASV